MENFAEDNGAKNNLLEAKSLKTALITGFYILGLCTFYGFFGIWRAVFAGVICFLLILLCIFNKLRPAFCLTLCFLFFGGFLNAKFHNKESDGFSIFAANHLLSGASISNTNNVLLKGRVHSIPAISKEKRIAKFYMEVYEADFANKSYKPSKTRILALISDENEKYKKIKIGDIIKIKGNLRSPKEATNPSEFDYKKYLKNKDVFMILYSDGNFEITGKPNIKQARNKGKELWWLALSGLDKTRAKIISKHGKYVKSPNLEILGGVVFGDDAINPPDDIKQSFINSGLLHLLAASGLNVALIFGIWWWAASLLNLPYRTNILSGIGIVVLYTFMTGFPPSILRASIMLILILIGKLMFKAADTLALIFFTAFIMLLFNPKLLNDVGFELSFLVTGGLITCIEPVCAKFKTIERAYKSKFSKSPAPLRAAAFLFSPISLLSIVLVPLVAQLWAAPLQGYYFNTFTPYSVFANIAVVPFIGIISFIGFVSSVLSLIPILGDFIVHTSSFILNPLITVLLTVSDFFSKLPGSIIKIPSGNIFLIIVYYSFILIFITSLKHNFKKLKINIALGIFGLILLLGGIFGLIQPQSGNFEILAYDVGNADSFLIKTPKNKYIMIDTGKLPYKGVSGAKRVMLEYLYDKNIRTLEHLIVTHFDNDHSGGTIDILENIRVKNVIIQKQTCDTKNSCEILKYLKENGINKEIASNKKVYAEENFEVQTFAPVLQKAATEGLNKDKFENETSTIVLIKNRGEYALFMADGGILAFNSIKNNLPKEIETKGLKLLKLGHHGAKDVLNREMLEYLKPEFIIISTGQNNYGHPSNETLELLEKPCSKNVFSKIYFTKNSGAIKFISRPNGKSEIHTFLPNKKFQKQKPNVLKKPLVSTL